MVFPSPLVDNRRPSPDFDPVRSRDLRSKLGELAMWLTQAPLLLSRKLWIIPLLGALVISLVGFWVRGRVENTTKAELTSRLQTVLNADVEALRLWFSEQELDARAFASDQRIRQAANELVLLDETLEDSPHRLGNAPAAETLHTTLTPLLENQGYLDYVLVGRNKRILASPYRPLVGRTAPPGYDLFLDRALAGRVAVSRPFARETPGQSAEGPTMFVAAPLLSTNGTVVAVLGLRLKPEEAFSRIFSVARMGQSGETYAFDRRGVMLTASRFEDELRAQGLLPNQPDSTSVFNLRLVDPTAHGRGPGLGKKGRRSLSLTKMASAATRGLDGFDVDGYPNYRGVRVIGAWAWLPEFEMGVATEVSVDEAYQTLYMLRRAFLVLFALLVLSGVGIFAFTVLVDRMQTLIRRNSLAFGRVGQYVLLQEIGRGANGMVYRARHALLRRPVAIKLLSPDLTDKQSVARFEQEVQMTSQLTHPNTVSVYDYGRTPEGLFYYAMEFLTGIDLHRLVRQFGPQPEGRVIHILRQVCGSLAEAHQVGLIHRDIKPANIVLTSRGGVSDLVKVLDFGLVKPLHRDSPDDGVVGTPHFMSPEAIHTPSAADARSDLYSLGAVGYWLLSGKTLFDESDVPRLLEAKAQTEPAAHSHRLNRAVSRDLELVLMRCLAKESSRRPASARELEEALAACAQATAWTPADAESWWNQNLDRIQQSVSTVIPEKTLVIDSAAREL